MAVPGIPNALGPRFDELAASVGVETCVSNDLLSVRAQVPVTRFFMRLSTPRGKTLRRRPHLNNGLLSRPGTTAGRLHQHPELDVTLHH